MMLEALELSLVEEDAAAVRALIDFHAVQLDLGEIHPALRALHPMQLLELLLLVDGLLRRLLHRPLLPPLELLLRKVLILGAARLVVFAHAAPPLGGF